ncbi:DUF4279 domain-containing protein [Enterococcus faecalis]|uniref:DUF4279 domain-containing protein n=1 Tax=Enterococcus faecalis TaxID=1351 RepID=UPI003BA1125E
MDETKLPIIEISLVLSSRTMETTKITDLLQIDPTTERSIDDWPDVIKNNTNLSEELKPRNEWNWTTKFQKCISVNEALLELINQFNKSITKINEISEEFSIEKLVTVLVHAKSFNMPEIGLEINTIEFLNRIKAPIYFDIYTY